MAPLPNEYSGGISALGIGKVAAMPIVRTAQLLTLPNHAEGRHLETPTQTQLIRNSGKIQPLMGDSQDFKYCREHGSVNTQIRTDPSIVPNVGFKSPSDYCTRIAHHPSY